MKSVLIVDDEKAFLLSLSQGLNNYRNSFNLLTAANGKEAIAILNRQQIDLIITDLQMPEVDGFSLIAYISQKFTTIPVIIMTAFGTEEIEKRLSNSGTFLFLEKPLDFDILVNKIFEALEASAKGRLHGISLPSFLQLISMEEKTCSLTVWKEGELGYLYFIKGKLVDAETGDMYGKEAALYILKWENAEIEFVNVCTKQERSITDSLEYLLLESYRIKDETSRNADQEMGNSITADFEEEKIMGINDVLSKFKELNGFIGVGLFSADGELLASGEDSAMEMDMVGALINNTVMNANKASQELGLGGSNEVDIVTEEGANIYVRCHVEGSSRFTLILICTQESQRGMVRLRLNQIMPELVAVI